MSKTKIIPNNIVGSTYLHRTELKNFQGDLKQQNNDKEIKMLSNRIKGGFDAPIYVRYENDNYILDGHQRLKALNLLADQGFLLEDDKVPVVYIKASTEKEAKEKVMEYNAKYSQFNEGELEIFVQDLDISDIPIPELIIDSEIAEEELDLPSGDKGEIETVTFTLHKEQAKEVRRAIDVARKMGEFIDTGNENGNGNAIARVCETFITQNGDE